MQELLAGGCSYVEWLRPVSSAHRMLSAGEWLTAIEIDSRWIYSRSQPSGAQNGSSVAIIASIEPGARVGSASAPRADQLSWIAWMWVQ